jgi:ferric-dicitrate binding protein FerR (iron transport regulator)
MMENRTPENPPAGPQVAADDGLETLFRQASARPTPLPEDLRQVREAVHGEWKAVTSRRRWRQRVVGLAAAAGVVLAVTWLVVDTTPAPTNPEFRILAQVEKISGHVEVFNGDSASSGAALAAGMPVYSGQSLVTGQDSGMSLLTESGVSLRIGESSELDLADEHSVELRSGRVYVDTETSASTSTSTLGNSGEALAILTNLGVIRHIGTQYMVRTATDRLLVGVRKGEVEVKHESRDESDALFVLAGRELSLDEQGDHRFEPFSSYGPEWQWAENLATGFELDGHTMDEFLEWVASETGLAIEYDSDAARSLARETMLHGTVDLPAREALDLVLRTSDLSAEIRDGVIEVSLKT